MRSATRAIVVVATFSDHTRRAAVCSDVEDARRFVSGEDQWTGAGIAAQRLGRGREEYRRAIEYRTTAELAIALKAAIRSRS